jgi:hypothetical protein
MGNLFVNGNRAIGFGGRTTGGTGTQRSAFRVRLNLPPVQGGGPDPQDVVNWLAAINEERNSWLNFHSANWNDSWDKYSGGWGLSKLYRQPGDTSVFQRIASYSSTPNVINGGRGWNVKADGTIDISDEFHIPGMTALVCKYWDSMTPEQREAFRAKVVLHGRRDDHGTENHATMNVTSSYMLAQMWPSETNWRKQVIYETGEVVSYWASAEMSATARTRIIQFVKALYSAGQSEDNSPSYTHVQLFVFHSLYTGCEALIARGIPEVGGTVQNIVEMKSVAEAAIIYFTVSLAARQLAHIYLAPYQRKGGFAHHNTGDASPDDNTHWLYWKDISGRTNRIITSTSVASSIMHASSWTPSPAIMSLGRGEMAPYVITGSAPQFGIWGQPVTSGSTEGMRYPDKTLGYAYRDRLFGMGSCCPTYSGNLNDGANHSGFNIAYKTADRFGEVEAYHEYYRSDQTSRLFHGTQSPFTQMAQYKNCTILLFDIPNADPFEATAPSTDRDSYYSNLRKDVFIKYPSTVTSEHQQSGWVFLEEVTPDGSIYIAFYTAQPYTIANGTASNFSSIMTPNPGDLKLVTSNGAKNVAIFDVSSSDYFPSFLAFRTAVLANPPTINIAGTVSATYTTTRGATIAATWAAPNYTIDPGKLRLPTVTLKPSVTVTTETAQTITELFPAPRGGSDRRLSGRPPLDASFLNMQNGTSLTLTTPRGTHSVVWNGDVPTITVS